MTVVSTALLTALAIRIPSINLATALGIMEDVAAAGYTLGEASFDLKTHEGRVAAVRASSEMMGHINSNSKIRAIKCIRDLAVCTLVEAKNAVDVVYAEVNPPRTLAGRTYDYTAYEPMRDEPEF